MTKERFIICSSGVAMSFIVSRTNIVDNLSNPSLLLFFNISVTLIISSLYVGFKTNYQGNIQLDENENCSLIDLPTLAKKISNCSAIYFEFDTPCPFITNVWGSFIIPGCLRIACRIICHVSFISCLCVDIQHFCVIFYFCCSFNFIED